MPPSVSIIRRFPPLATQVLESVANTQGGISVCVCAFPVWKHTIKTFTEMSPLWDKYESIQELEIVFCEKTREIIPNLLTVSGLDPAKGLS